MHGLPASGEKPATRDSHKEPSYQDHETLLPTFMKDVGPEIELQPDDFQNGRRGRKRVATRIHFFGAILLFFGLLVYTTISTVGDHTLMTYPEASYLTIFLADNGLFQADLNVVLLRQAKPIHHPGAS